MEFLKAEVCIIGAGPAGSTTSLFLSKYGIKSILIDKQSFPKNKVCGEGIRGQVENVLKLIDAKLVKKFNELSKQLDNLKVTLSSGFSLTTSFSKQKAANIKTVRRLYFDNFLINEVKQKDNIDFLDNKFITNFTRISKNEVLLSDKEKTVQIQTKLVILATGTEAIYKNNSFFKPSPKSKQLVGLRVHFSNVPSPKLNKMELLFPKQFYDAWIFITYLPKNYVNIISVIRKEKITQQSVVFRDIFNKLLKNIISVRPEFINAIQDGKIEGTHLNLYGKNKSFSGDNYLLVGDAATSSNPILGFGIGHAMYSAKLAANQIKKSLDTENFTSSFLKNYDKLWWEKLGGEHQLGRIVYHLLKFPKILEIIMKSNFLIAIFSDTTIEKNYFNPLFYIKKLFT